MPPRPPILADRPALRALSDGMAGVLGRHLAPRATRHAHLAMLTGLFLLLAGNARADDPATVPSDPVFEAVLTDGSTATGRIKQFGGPPANLRLVEEKSNREVPLDRLVKLTREGEPPPSPPEGSLVVFPDGDRLRAVLNTAGDRALETLPNALGDQALAIPIDTILALVLTPPAEPEALEALIRRVRVEPRQTEILWLANGDRLTGGFLGLTAQKVRLEREAGPVEIDRAGVVALGFDPTLVHYPKPEGTSFELTLADGSRLGVTDCRIAQGQVQATTRFGAEIRLGLAELARVHVRSDAIAYLAEREPVASEFVGYVGPHPKRFGRDRALDGGPIRLGGQAYDHGLATQSRTLLAYRLDGQARRFQASIGLDDRAGPLGSVIFRVLVDGRERFASPALTVRDPPRAIDLDITGARTLILATEFGARGDVQDYANWVEARLIR